MGQFVRSALLKAAVFILPLLWGTSAFGQATLQASSTSSTVNRTGHTELVGDVTLTVVSGTTAAGTVEIIYGRPLTNTVISSNSAAGVTVTGTGGLAGATIAAVLPDGIIVNLPVGATIGASATLSGVRISVVGVTTPTLSANISATGNSVVAGQNSTRVVSQIVDTMVVDATSSTSVTFTNGVLVSAPGAFLFGEGFVRGFSGHTGTLGQTVPTQVIFRVLGLPDNVSITFPAQVAANSGAKFTTNSGVDESLTNQSTSQRVTYLFSDASSSDFEVDNFSVTPGVSVTGPVKSGTFVIQATVGPIGAAKPDTNFPSTAVPRFDEQFLPPVEVPVPTPTRFFFTVPNPTQSESIVVTNSSTGGASATLRARREDGSLISGTNLRGEATVNLIARQTAVFSLTQLFGTAADTNQIGSIEVESQNDQILPSSVSVLAGGSITAPSVRESTQGFLPFDRRSSTDVPLIAISTSGTAGVNVSFTLRSALGQTLGIASRSLLANGSLRVSLTGLFNMQPGALPLSGYVQLESTSPLRSAIYNNPSQVSDGVSGLLPVARTPMIYPYFAFGAGYNTVVSLINVGASVPARITMTLFRPDGTAISPSAPVVREIPVANRMDFDLAALFGTGGSGISTGYIVLTVQPVATNPFAGLPPLIGTVRVSTSTSSALTPLVTDPSTEFFVTPTTETAVTYTGLAITNDGSSSANVSIEVFAGNGSQLGSTTFALPGNSSRIQLLREFIPSSLSHDGGYVRISSPSGLNVIAFRGNFTSTELIHLPLQKLP